MRLKLYLTISAPKSDINNLKSAYTVHDTERCLRSECPNLLARVQPSAVHDKKALTPIWSKSRSFFND